MSWQFNDDTDSLIFFLGGYFQRVIGWCLRKKLRRPKYYSPMCFTTLRRQSYCSMNKISHCGNPYKNKLGSKLCGDASIIESGWLHSMPLHDETTTFFEFYHSSTLNSHLDKELVIQIFKIDSGLERCVEDLTKPSKKLLYLVKPRSWIHSIIFQALQHVSISTN